MALPFVLFEGFASPADRLIVGRNFWWFQRREPIPTIKTCSYLYLRILSFLSRPGI